MRFIISQLRSHIARRENVLHILFGVMVAVSCWSVFSQPGLAVRNNKANIAGSVLQSLRDISQNVDWDYVNNYGGPTGKIKSPPCLTKGTRKIYHFQYPWLSQAGKPTVNQAIVVDQGTNEVKVQYNRVAGYCHYVFTPVLPLSSSKIVDPSELRVTGTEISGISAKIVETGGSLLVPNRAGELS